jgi:hypothetical protein
MADSASPDVIRLRDITELIEYHQKELRVLFEFKNHLLTEFGKSLVEHHPVKWKSPKKLHGRVTSVECSCGAQTVLRVPLNSISEFVCPKDERRPK